MLSPLSRGLPPPRSQWELLEVGGRGADLSLCSSCPHRTHPPSHPRSRSRGGGIKPQSGGGWATEDPDCTPPNGAPREGVYDPLRPPTKGSNTPLRRLCGCGEAQKRAAIAQLPPHHGGVRAFRAPHRTAPRGSTAGGSEPKGAELLRGGGMGPPWAEPHQSRGGGWAGFALLPRSPAAPPPHLSMAVQPAISRGASPTAPRSSAEKTKSSHSSWGAPNAPCKQRPPLGAWEGNAERGAHPAPPRRPAAPPRPMQASMAALLLLLLLLLRPRGADGPPWQPAMRSVLSAALPFAHAEHGALHMATQHRAAAAHSPRVDGPISEAEWG